jgi:hypothetical protein
MHTQDTKNKFLDLRARGWSPARIAEHLHVSKNTLPIHPLVSSHANLAELNSLALVPPGPFDPRAPESNPDLDKSDFSPHPAAETNTPDT